ncbi:MAG: hypothetical protein ABH826_04570 [Patescibacteria group bacterium]
MQVTKKTWEVIGAITIVLALIIIIIFILFKEKTTDLEDLSDTVPIVEFPEEIDLSGPVEYLPNPIARSFVERFGSFSTESDYANVDDVMSLATVSLQTRLHRIAEEARQSISSAYYGVSTKVIAMEVVAETDSAASIKITTQRKESIDSPANTTISYQEIDLELVRNGDSWLVDNFQWN